MRCRGGPETFLFAESDPDAPLPKPDLPIAARTRAADVITEPATSTTSTCMMPKPFSVDAAPAVPPTSLDGARVHTYVAKTFLVCQEHDIVPPA